MNADGGAVTCDGGKKKRKSGENDWEKDNHVRSNSEIKVSSEREFERSRVILFISVGSAIIKTELIFMTRDRPVLNHYCGDASERRAACMKNDSQDIFNAREPIIVFQQHFHCSAAELSSCSMIPNRSSIAAFSFIHSIQPWIRKSLAGV